MYKKEKFQDFNQSFSSHLSNFSSTTKLVEETLIEYYISALCPNIAMFVKRAVKCSLVKKYEEANKVEDELDSIAKHTPE